MMAAEVRWVRRLAPLVLLLLAACAAPSGGTAPARPAEAEAGAAQTPPAARPVRAAYVVLGSAALPAWLAEDEGIFARYGLAVELTYIAGQVRIGEALVAGELDVGIGPAELAIGPALEGADLAMVASWNNRTAFSAVVQPDIRSVADLQGKRVGVTRRRSLSETWANMTLSQFGLVPERDYALLAIGGQAEQLAALQAGAVDFLHKPFDDQALLDSIARALARGPNEGCAHNRPTKASTGSRALPGERGAGVGGHPRGR
jgi:ABC-type nitrate/sulfonate/bicarbonate transport system substrate-binding protein